MKVIEQIIKYLDSRGALSPKQIEYLKNEGFYVQKPYSDYDYDYELYDDYGYEPDYDDEYWEYYYYSDLHEDSEQHRVTRRYKKKARVQHKNPLLKAPDLCRRLGERIKGWRSELYGMLQLARLLSSDVTWIQAADVIRNAEPEALYEALPKGLETRSPSLKTLWKSLSLDDYHFVLRLGFGGPAVKAYQVILKSTERGNLGKHGWLLREWEVRWVYNLIQAQRYVLSACRRIYDEQPELISRAICRDYHTVAYWAFVLLYHARRGYPDYSADVTPNPTEHIARRHLPDEHKDWLRAWAHATIMDSQSLTPLLKFYQNFVPIDYDSPNSEERQRSWFHHHLLCPREWDADYNPWGGWPEPK
jgi:hypothetical protein